MTPVDYIEQPESLEVPTMQEEAERLISYWEIHGEDAEAVSKWAVSDLLRFARKVAPDY